MPFDNRGQFSIFSGGGENIGTRIVPDATRHPSAPPVLLDGSSPERTVQGFIPRKGAVMDKVVGPDDPKAPHQGDAENGAPRPERLDGKAGRAGAAQDAIEDETPQAPVEGILFLRIAQVSPDPAALLAGQVAGKGAVEPDLVTAFGSAGNVAPEFRDGERLECPQESLSHRNEPAGGFYPEGNGPCPPGLSPFPAIEGIGGRTLGGEGTGDCGCHLLLIGPLPEIEGAVQGDVGDPVVLGRGEGEDHGDALDRLCEIRMFRDGMRLNHVTPGDGRRMPLHFV